MTDFANMSSKEIKTELSRQSTNALSCIVLGVIAAIGGSIMSTPRGAEHLDRNMHFGYIALAVSLVMLIIGVVLIMRYSLNSKLAAEVMSRQADDDASSDDEDDASQAKSSSQKGI